MFVNQAAFEEVRRHQQITKYEIYPLQSEDIADYQVLAEDIPSLISEDVRILQKKAKIPFWAEEKGKAWSKIAKLMAKTPQRLFVLSGHPSAKSANDSDDTFEFFDGFEQFFEPNKCGVWFKANSGVYHSPMATYCAWHRPMAVYVQSQNKTFFVYGDYNNAPVINYYNHSSQTFGEPVQIGTNSDDDPHKNPTILIDEDGYIYIFWGAHSDPNKVSKSTAAYNITNWTTKPTFGSTITYPQPWQLKTGELFVCYRDYGKWGYRTSTNGADSWSSNTNIVDFSGTNQSIYLASVAETGSYPRKIHLAWSAMDEGIWHQRWDVYYAYSDDGGTTWKKRDGTAYTLPIIAATAEKVYESGDEGVWIKDIQLDTNGNPYILFISANRTTYQGNWKFARYSGGNWVTTTVASSDHMYDGGGFAVLANDDFRIYAPTTVSQVGEDGGDIDEWKSINQGQSWSKTKSVTSSSAYSHNHVKTVWNHQQNDFRVFWCYGDSAPIPATKKVTIYNYGEGLSNPNLIYDFEMPGVNWIVDAGTVNFASIEQKKNGNQSMEVHSASKVYTNFNHGAYAIENWVYVTSLPADKKFYFLHGDSTKEIMIAVQGDGKIMYYDGLWKDTGSTITLNTWFLLGLQNMNWTTHIYDITLNRSVIQTTAGMRDVTTYTDKYFISAAYTTGDLYIDNVVARKYIFPEPLILQKQINGKADAIRAVVG